MPRSRAFKIGSIVRIADTRIAEIYGGEKGVIVSKPKDIKEPQTSYYYGRYCFVKILGSLDVSIIPDRYLRRDY